MPILVSAQLLGPYATTFNGNGSLILEFARDSSFTYEMFANQKGERGHGRFLMKNDTLLFQFVPFLDSGEVDCSFHRIEKDSGKIAKRNPALLDSSLLDSSQADKKPLLDSMWVIFRIKDCQTGKSVEGISVGVISKKGIYKLGLTDTAGLLRVKLTHDLSKRYRLAINSPQYHERQFDFTFDWNAEVDVFLYQSKISILEEGQKRRYKVNSFSKKHLNITPIPTENKNPIHLRRGKNLTKINRQEYKAYQKALTQP